MVLKEERERDLKNGEGSVLLTSKSLKSHQTAVVSCGEKGAGGDQNLKRTIYANCVH